MFDKEIYIERRRKLKEELKSGVIIINGNLESARNYKGNDYPFEQDSNFLYYFGLNMPNLIGVIDLERDEEYIFGRDYTIDDIIWMGNQKLLKESVKDVGIENFKEIDEIANFLKDYDNIMILPQCRGDSIIQLCEILDISKKELEEKVSIPLVKAVIKQRNKKKNEEIERIEEAVNITRKMHLEAMRVIKAGMKEYEVVSAIESIATKYNATPSFFTIFTKNGQILHNHNHSNTLENGDIVILDCGARTKDGYCGDMTTTIPVNGKFDERQKDLYSLLIEMFETAEKYALPNINYKDVHLKVWEVMAEGMVKRGFMRGNTKDLVEKGVCALFMPHGLGHMLGLDVHDMEGLGEDYVGYEEFERSTQFGLKSLRLARKLKEGYVFTIEPGIYFIPELIKKWRDEKKFEDYLNYDMIEKYLDFGGMRYEGDFLIIKDGNRRLGEKMPKYYYEVEEVINNR